ncbi:hypothetical protein NO2_0613 [Candidatus Termititenax persephonae]|uniref:Uncharacterized protein n=1 Tax=Candidatus Termititenax persephonae TaxID=2218525 RepID=A0A388TGQ3_9BACT|nr:hypothetical protein NO2_0613 [Candidatus Termititenax persephonae]
MQINLGEDARKYVDTTPPFPWRVDKTAPKEIVGRLKDLNKICEKNYGYTAFIFNQDIYDGMETMRAVKRKYAKWQKQNKDMLERIHQKYGKENS